MIFGTGIDIIEIVRIKQALQNKRFVERVFTAAERAYCERRGAQAAASFAARFAGKEAVMKAFGTGLSGGSLLDIEILPDAQGCPRVQISGRFADLAEQRGICEIYISLSHAREYAVAQATCWRG